MLTGVLGGNLTQAYLVRSAAAQPLLTLHAQDRATVETAAARIDLPHAMLTVDANGAYRGAQLFRVDNSLEQYLEIQLPVGARLWTAHVAGEPVKPAAGKPTANGGDVVRIPLIKTARGDADYEVVLKYGGQLGQLGAISHVEFPLIHTVNIHVELSQVELDVPRRSTGSTSTARWGKFAAKAIWQPVGWPTTQDKSSWPNRHYSFADPFARTRAKRNLRDLQAAV